MFRTLATAPDEPLPVPVGNDDVVDVYDALAGWYDRVVAPLERPTRLLGTVLLDLERGERVCDVGCGPGHALPRLADCVGPGGFVLGVDAAPGMVARAAHRVRRADLGERVTLLTGDARRLPVADDALDAVFLAETLELFDDDDARAVLGEIRRVLAPGGRLCVTSMDRADSEDAPFVRAYEWAYRHVPGYDRVGCRPVYVTRTLRDGGFRVERVERWSRWGVWPSTVALARPRPGD